MFLMFNIKEKIFNDLTIYAMRSRFFRSVLQLARKLCESIIYASHRKNIEQLIKSNIKNNYQGLKDGDIIFTHINPKRDLNFAHIEKMLGRKFSSKAKGANVALIWGTRSLISRYIIVKKALKEKLPLLIAEDGFVRSIEISANASPGLSCVLDYQGVYYDTEMGSSIVNHLNSDWEIDKDDFKNAQRLISMIVSNDISKYNFVAPAKICFNTDNKYEGVTLVIDQRKDDQSIYGALADKSTFNRMLTEAMNDNPNDLIIVKIHPDATVGKYTSYYHRTSRAEKNIRVISESVNPISLLKAVDKVYTVSSQMGMEALMCNKKVFCYGVPFYSDRGLTIDMVKNTKHNRKRSLEEVFFTAYIKYSYYFSPQNDRQGTLEETINYLISKRNLKIKKPPLKL